MIGCHGCRATLRRAKPSWSPFRERLPTDAELTAWFRDGQCNIAVVGGAVSGGLVVLDIESILAFESWRRFATTLLDEAIIATLPVVRTGQGKHVYFRMVNPIGNRTLAKRRRQRAERGTPRYEVVAETRGEGGLALAPPSV
ncbi:MAG: bifunctional DNA primase/polymerase, partial [Pyrinomonadaceae bacterium]|nr:bifunctional DNA primase/polymerase [Pyrinomonadaceae bacterium]